MVSTMLSTTREVTAVALLTAVGVAMFVVESFIPTPLPFLKVGLANISSLVAMMVMGVPQMFMVVIIRVVVGSMLVGSLFTPGFILAIGGGITSATAMALTKRCGKELFSPVGISLIGSLTHVATQFLLVLWLYVQSSAVFFLLPLLVASGFVGGLVVGWITSRLLPMMQSARPRV